MIKIIVTSDCHGNDEFLKEIAETEKDIDWIVHCGDSCGVEHKMGYIFQNSRIAMVAGNCDIGGQLNDRVVFEAGGHKFFVFHGNQVMGYNHRRIAYLGKRQGCDVVLCGHTHVPFIDQSFEGVTILNPGSLTLPRQEGRKRSYGVVLIDESGNAEYSIKYKND